MFGFYWLEERFLKSGFHLIYVTLRTATLARIMSNQDIDRFVQEQDMLRKIASKLLLPKLELDISEMDIQETSENIGNWYEEVSSYTKPEDPQPDKFFLSS